MKFLTAYFTLSLVSVYNAAGQRRGLVLFPEEMLDRVGDGDGHGPVDVDRSVDLDKKGPASLPKAVANHDRIFRVSTDSPVRHRKRFRITTVRPVDEDAEGEFRVIYPTEAEETATAVAQGGTKEEQAKEIPENLLISMNNVRSADEFLRRFVASVPGNESEFWGARRPGIMGRKGLSGGQPSLQVTPFAGCQPEKTVVKVENSEGNGVLLWPPCVFLDRCGGCCTSELMTCRPTATSAVNITVLQARYTGPQSQPFSNEGVRTMTMEQHDKCACGCKELPGDCTALQKYRRNECRCVCANENEATLCQQSANKIWDGRDCACKCRNTRDCSSGLYFSINTCRCEALRFSLSARTAAFFHEQNETGSLNDEGSESTNSKEATYNAEERTRALREPSETRSRQNNQKNEVLT